MKKLFETFWEVLKGLFSASWKLAIVAVGISVSLAAYEHFHRPRWYKYEKLSNNVMMRTHRFGYIQLFDAVTGHKISSKKYRFIYYPSSSDSLTVFQSRSGMRGFLNANTGDVVIPARYRHAWVFSEGIGAVVGEDDSLRFIGHDGEPLFCKAFGYSTDYEYVFHDGHCIVAESTENGDLMGMIDRNGVWTIPQIYHDITRLQDMGIYRASSLAGNGSMRYGLLDLSCNWMLPVEYQEISFSDSDNTLYLTKDYVKQHVSSNGKILDPFVIDLLMTMDYSALGEQPVNDAGEMYTRTVTSAKIAKYYVNSLCGLFDLNAGKPLTAAKFSDIFMVTDDVIRCQLEGSTSEVIYNSAGMQIQ